MAFSYGFYNSLSGDRKYDAVQISMIFDGIIEDGIYASIGKCFAVKEHSVDKSKVIVQPGRAWFRHTWNYNDADVAIDIPTSDLVRKRIDALVIDIQSDDTADSRINSFQWVLGTPDYANPSKPTMANEEKHKQIPLCYITRLPNNETVTQAQIRSTIGTPECPFVTGPLKVLSLNELLGQWQTQLDEFVLGEERDFTKWMNDEKTSFAEWMTTEKETFFTWRDTEKTSFTNWMNQEQFDWISWRDTMETQMNEFSNSIDAWGESEKTEVLNWFQNLQNMLDSNQAANLQNQIDSLKTEEFNTRYDFGNKTITISEDGKQIETVTDESRITSVFSINSSGNTVVERLVAPTDTSIPFNYKTTTTIGNDNRTIVVESEKVPR